MATERLAPTRMNLLRARRSLVRVQRGVALTRRKREALVMELFAIARPAVSARAQVTEAVTKASLALSEALANHGVQALGTMSLPQHEPEVEFSPSVVWGIDVSDVRVVSPVLRSADARGLAPSLTSPSSAQSAEGFERLVELLIAAAPREQRMRRLGEALAQTNRRLRTLEQRLAPSLKTRFNLVRQQLEEHEREEQMRLRLARH